MVEYVTVGCQAEVQQTLWGKELIWGRHIFVVQGKRIKIYESNKVIIGLEDHRVLNKYITLIFAALNWI